MNVAYYYFVKQNDAKQNTRQLCSHMGRYIVASVAGRTFNKAPEAFGFSEGMHGKPYLTEHPDFHFSISHSENLITVAFSASQVGIDCEKIRKINLSLAKKHFTEAEQNYIYSAPEETQKRFFEVWTAKEAYLKKIGIGITVPLNTIDTADKKFFTANLREFVITACNDEASEFELRDFRQSDLCQRYK